MKTNIACRALASLALAAVLAACELRLTVDVDVEGDGAGALAVTLGADDELAAMARAHGAAPLDGLAEAGRALHDDGWTVTEKAGEVTLSTRFADPDELAALTADLGATLSGPELTPLEAMALEVSDDRITLTGAAGLRPTDAVSELGMTPEEAVALMDGAVDYRLRATMPGEILDPGGAAVDGRTLVWTVEPGQRVDLVAAAARPTRAWVPYAWGAGALTAVVAGLATWRLRRRTPSPGPGFGAPRTRS